MKPMFPIAIGICAGLGISLAIALFGADALVWGLIGGAAIGTVLGAATSRSAGK